MRCIVDGALHSYHHENTHTPLPKCYLLGKTRAWNNRPYSTKGNHLDISTPEKRCAGASVRAANFNAAYVVVAPLHNLMVERATTACHREPISYSTSSLTAAWHHGWTPQFWRHYKLMRGRKVLHGFHTSSIGCFTDFAQALTATSSWQDKISSNAMLLPCCLFYLTPILNFNWFYMDQQS
jgi:hypothetical protein